MLTFDQLIVPAKKTITLRGVEREIRFVTAADHACIEAAFPWPDPPLGPDKTKGSLAPPVPNYEDEGYMAGCKLIEFKRLAAHAAIGLRYQTKAGLGWDSVKPEERTTYLTAAVEELSNSLAGYELQNIRRELISFTLSDLTADALGN